jgi:hypothetical protein
VDEDTYVKGILGVYELGRVDLLRDVFVWAYRRSCARYSAIRQSLGEPDPFRLRYRDQISVTIQTIVREGLEKEAASKWIQTKGVAEIPKEDQRKFQEVVESEIWGLHIGNIARYRLRSSEFEQWQEIWKS